MTPPNNPSTQSPSDESPRYVIISPVKDEVRYIEETIRSVMNQTVKPAQWVIVDDGSEDGTSDLIRKYSESCPWIRTLRIDRDARRFPGSAVIRAFDEGYRTIDRPFDFIVKLDCDLRFEPRYFERLFDEFQKNPRLGIASGLYVEKHKGKWRPVSLPDYHAAGASKVVKRLCLEQIGGFIPERGWDTVDEIRSWSRGWETRHFPDIVFDHLKNEGSGIGKLRTNVMLGEISYLVGTSRVFFAAKVGHKMFIGWPIFMAGLLMLFGYLKSSILRRKLLVTREEAVMYKRLLLGRLLRGVAGRHHVARHCE